MFDRVTKQARVKCAMPHTAIGGDAGTLGTRAPQQRRAHGGDLEFRKGGRDGALGGGGTSAATKSKQKILKSKQNTDPKHEGQSEWGKRKQVSNVTQ